MEAHKASYIFLAVERSSLYEGNDIKGIAQGWL